MTAPWMIGIHVLNCNNIVKREIKCLKVKKNVCAHRKRHQRVHEVSLRLFWCPQIRSESLKSAFIIIYQAHRWFIARKYTFIERVAVKLLKHNTSFNVDKQWNYRQYVCGNCLVFLVWIQFRIVKMNGFPNVAKEMCDKLIWTRVHKLGPGWTKDTCFFFFVCVWKMREKPRILQKLAPKWNNLWFSFGKALHIRLQNVNLLSLKVSNIFLFMFKRANIRRAGRSTVQLNTLLCFFLSICLMCKKIHFTCILHDWSLDLAVFLLHWQSRIETNQWNLHSLIIS